MPPASPVVASPAPSSLSIFREGLFNGKVLFCTGGGSGICREMTEAVLRHGADATIVGRNIERNTQAANELAAATGRKVLAVKADVREPKQLQDAVAKTIEQFGRIDYVICGAAGNFLAPISGLSENAFKTVISIDVLGTYNTVKATLPYLHITKGSYIHVSATLHYRGTPLQAHVSAAKAGVDALSAVIAIEEGPRGIRSNVISPGPIEGTEGMIRLSTPSLTNSSIPLQRMGEKTDIGNATVFLFSDAAVWITGQVLAIDGGELHTRGTMGNYPQNILDPKPRL
ncbi:NAD(P)-binding protein [Hysterangium stoloniferum]|nr:NAD(P)-binding protein [Hysterangium stoloniferum]